MKKSKFNLNNLKGKITKYIYNMLVDSLNVIACALWYNQKQKYWAYSTAFFKKITFIGFPIITKVAPDLEFWDTRKKIIIILNPITQR